MSPGSAAPVRGRSAATARSRPAHAGWSSPIPRAAPARTRIQRKRLARNGSAAGQGNRGTARFLDFPEGKVEVNEARIAAAARWDGLRGVVAWGLDDRDPCNLVIQYRQHAEIEACFRANKHDLSIRPVLHWKPRRVRAHVAICYRACCCLQHLRFRLTAQGTTR
ncbi:MAG: hypothetical protein OXC93_09335 [Rhodospirillaceae bacterium]|nr:hypothetical protein [Rhodospirillaceae bacterium]